MCLLCLPFSSFQPCMPAPSLSLLLPWYVCSNISPLLHAYTRENVAMWELYSYKYWLTYISTSLHFESWFYCVFFFIYLLSSELKWVTTYETPTGISVACRLCKLLSIFILLQGHCYDWPPYLFHALYGSSCQLSLQHFVISVMVDKVPHVHLTPNSLHTPPVWWEELDLIWKCWRIPANWHTGQFYTKPCLKNKWIKFSLFLIPPWVCLYMRISM